MSVFDCLFDMENTPMIARLTNNHKINPLLIPGANSPLYIGVGLTADIRLEHLEMATVGRKHNSLISGSTLFRLAEGAKLTLKKVDSIFKKCVNSNSTLPFGEDVSDFLKRLAAMIIEYKVLGKYADDGGDSGEQSSDTTVITNMPTLMQGVAAAAVAAKEKTKADWKYKFIPVARWFVIALFVKNGLARSKLEDTLPLLKDGDHTKEEIGNHLGLVVCREDKQAKAHVYKGDGRIDLSTGGFNTKDHLLASVVSLMAKNNETISSIDTNGSKRDQMWLLQAKIGNPQWQINCYIQFGKECDFFFKKHEALLEQFEKLRNELAFLFWSRLLKGKLTK